MLLPRSSALYGFPTASEEQGFCFSREIVYHLLQECIRNNDLIGGRRVFSAITCNGLDAVPVLCNHLIRLFAACGSLIEADHVFSSILRPSIFTWNSIIFAHVNHGSERRALELYQEMQEKGWKPDAITFLAALKSCMGLSLLDHGRIVHNQIILSDLENETSIGNTIIDMYAKSGTLVDAYRTFTKLCDPNVVSWTIIISSYAQSEGCTFALQLFNSMLQTGTEPNRATFMAALKVCSVSGYTHEGKLIHAHIIISGCVIDEELRSTVLNMYSKCGNLEDAQQIFDELPKKDLVVWGTMISGYALHGDGRHALTLYESMQQEGLAPDNYIYSSILKACARVKTARSGHLIHSEMLKKGFYIDHVLGTALVDMYAQCCNLESAQKIFNGLHESNEISWSVLIKGYVQHGIEISGLQLYEKMLHKGLHPSKSTYVTVLQACSRTRASTHGRIIHDQIIRNNIESDVAIGSSVIEFYAQCGSFIEAHLVFDQLLTRDEMAWGVLFDGYLKHEWEDGILHMFENMMLNGEKPDAFIFICTLKGCPTIHHLQLIHHQIIREGLEEVLGTILIDLYGKHGRIIEARKIFENLTCADVTAWTAIISGYSEYCSPPCVLNMLEEMKQTNIQMNKTTFLCYVTACRNMKVLSEGMQVHDQIIRCALDCEVPIGNALMDMYVDCGHIGEAQKIFDSLKEKDIFSWSIILGAHVQHENDLLALELFERMQIEGCPPNHISYRCILRTCGNIGAIEKGKLIHHVLLESSETDALSGSGSALIDMYARCGFIADAHRLFLLRHCKDVSSWSALISGYAKYGKMSSAGECFRAMQQQGIKPNELLFTNVILACCHEGQMEEAFSYFKSMRGDHGVDASLEHYGCIIDLLGRLGSLKEACYMLQTMPMSPDTVVWRALLTGCRLYDDEELGSHCFGEVTFSFSKLRSHSQEENPASDLDILRRAGGRHLLSPKNYERVLDFPKGFILI